MQSVLVVSDHPNTGYYRPFAHIGPCAVDLNLLKKPEDVALVVFTGGSDVGPWVYGEKANDKTYDNPERDRHEKAVFERVVKLGLPIAGICRGAQLICALSGGKLVQHINGHGRDHHVKTDQGKKVWVTSTHHQMQLPPPEADVIAWAEPRLSDCYEGAPGVDYEPEREYDVVYYPDTNALGMQYHPEFMRANEEGFRYCGQLVNRFFGLG